MTASPAMRTEIKFPFSEQNALLQIRSEFMQSFAFMNPKQMQWIEYLRAYFDGRTLPDKVKINLAFSNINALQSLEAQDKLKIKFVWSNYEDFAKTDNWNKLAENEYQKLGMTLLDVEWWYNKYMYWVKIKTLDLDEDGEVVSTIMDTRLWFPDPSGCFEAERFRWMWFRKFMSKLEMKELWFVNIDQFRRLKGDDILEYNPYLWFSNAKEMGTNLEMNLYAVYMHMTIINGHKYIVYTNDEMNAIGKVIKCTDIIPVLKKRTLGLKWELRPVELDYRRPQYDNPTGISVMDLTYDKQVALSQNVNLAQKRAIRISLWWHKFYNTNMIKNKADIAKMWVEPVLVGIDLKNNQSLQNAVYEQPIAAQMPSDNFNMQDTLQYHTKLGLWFDSNQLGLWSQESQTATETNVIQANSNVIQWFGVVLNVEHEKRRWLKWYLLTKRAIKWKKRITVINSLGEKALEFGKDDLMMWEIDDVIIKSTNEINAKNQQQLQQLQLMMPFIWELWEYAKRKIYRDIAELITWDKDKALEYVYYSSDELQAMIDVRMLNNDEELQPVEDYMNQDHIAYIIWYQQAKDWPAKQIAIKNRMDALRQQEIAKKAQMQAEQQQSQWAMQNQMAWAMIQQSMQWQAAGKPIATNAQA